MVRTIALRRYTYDEQNKKKKKKHDKQMNERKIERKL